MKYQRIMIFGRPGSGKSTFAHTLSKILQVHVYYLDRYFFIKGWHERDYQQFMRIQNHILSQARWIVDGNSLQSLELRYAHADLVLYFKYPKGLCYWRLFKRLWYKDQAIHDRAPSCEENIRFRLLQYVWKFENRVSKDVQALQVKYPAVKLIEINNDKDLKSILMGFEPVVI